MKRYPAKGNEAAKKPCNHFISSSVSVGRRGGLPISKQNTKEKYLGSVEPSTLERAM